MAEDGGDKTEQPTPKRLQDARKKGDIAKGRELTSTATLLVWLVMGALCLRMASERLAALCEGLFARVASGWRAEGFSHTAALLGWQSVELALLLVAVLGVPVAVLGTLVEYLQAGPVLAFEKVAPKLEHLNPAAGLKRMFSLDNLIELFKGILKTALLLAIGVAVAQALLPEAMRLALATDRPAQHLGALVWQGTVQTLAWTVGVFAGVAFLDVLWTRHRFMKKMRMSLRDIRQEMKESEGDPHLKQQRKQAHAEWSQRNQAAAARGANALIVNPTHVAIAIDFEPGRCPVPTVSAKGEDHVARAMREAAGPLQARWQTLGGPAGLGIGLSRGEATVGPIGFEGRLDYAAIGSVTNRASRLCAAALPGEILTCEATARAVAHDVLFGTTRWLELRGLGADQAAHPVLDLLPPEAPPPHQR